MTDYYLNKISTKLPSVQGRQVMNLLRKKKEAGQFRTLDELKSKLKELTDSLLQQRIIPTLKLYLALGKEDIASETYNEMLERIEDDLQAAFTETDNLYEILDAHNALIKDVALRNLEVGVNQLEAQVATYEFLMEANDYDQAVYNTFRSSAGSFTDRTARVARFAFVDPRYQKTVPPEQAAVVDILSEQLVLAATQESFIPLRAVELLGGNSSTRSELDVSFPDLKLSNILDGLTGTFWVHPVLLSSPSTTGVQVQIAVDLPSLQDLTFLDLEPAVSKPMSLTSVTYLDKHKQIQTLLSTAQTLNRERLRLMFNTITAERLILTFTQKNHTEVQFVPGALSSTAKVTAGTYVRPATLDQDSDLEHALTNPFLSADILGLSSISADPVRYYEYLVGLDNIRAGTYHFQNRSIFVSDKHSVDNLRHLALRVQESRPVEVYGSHGVTLASHTYPARNSTEDQNFYHSSLEYWAIVELLTAAGDLEATLVLPLLPLNAHRIYHEQLVFTWQISSTALLKDSGSLMHYCLADGGDVTVYRNGLPLSYGTDWEFVADGHASGLTVISPNTGTRMKRGIQVLDRARQTDYYTVSYTPLLSSTFLSPATGAALLSTVDLTGTLAARLTPNGTIILDPERISSSITRANVYLSVLLRRNSSNEAVSPALDEFLLAFGVQDLEKFAG